MTTALLNALCDDLDVGATPDFLKTRIPNVERCFNQFQSYLTGKAVNVYGANTFPGHRAGEAVAGEDRARYQQELLVSHAIGGPPFASPDRARAVTLAKAVSLSYACTPISAQVYRGILGALDDARFQPSIPLTASYSSGDVIPAAHWALAVLDHAGINAASLSSGEAMALVNGAFVHVGLCLDIQRRMQALWTRLGLAARLSLQTLSADGRPLEWAEKWTADPRARALLGAARKQLQPVSGHAAQDPVSLRTTAQQIEAAATAWAEFERRLDAALARPSENPAFQVTGEGGDHSPSGAFAEPGLTIATSGLIESLLMLGWNSTERLSHLLSGQTGELARDAVTPSQPLGLIQWPKLAKAHLDMMRRQAAARAFVSGGQASGGTEDFWTFGVVTAVTAGDAIDRLETLLALEVFAAIRAGGLAGHDFGLPGDLVRRTLKEKPDEALAREITLGVAAFEGAKAAS